MQGVEMWWRGVRLGVLNCPPTDVSPEQNDAIAKVVSVNIAGGMLHLDDQGRPFASFADHFIQNTSVVITLKGQADIVAQSALGRLEVESLPMDASTTLDGTCLPQIRRNRPVRLRTLSQLHLPILACSLRPQRAARDSAGRVGHSWRCGRRRGLRVGTERNDGDSKVSQDVCLRNRHALSPPIGLEDEST